MLFLQLLYVVDNAAHLNMSRFLFMRSDNTILYYSIHLSVGPAVDPVLAAELLKHGDGDVQFLTHCT
jgi:hypothetical protein